MAANLEWVSYRWKEWIKTVEAQKALELDLSGVAKLFAAYCLDRLKAEIEAETEITGA